SSLPPEPQQSRVSLGSVRVRFKRSCRLSSLLNRARSSVWQTVQFIHPTTVPGRLKVAVDLQRERRAVVPYRVLYVEQGCAVLNEPRGKSVAQGMSREVREFRLAEDLRPHAFSEVVRVHRVPGFVDKDPRGEFTPTFPQRLFLTLHFQGF